MKRIFFILMILLCLFWTSLSMATDTVTCTYDEPYKANIMTRAVQDITFTFSSDDGTIATNSDAGAYAKNITGFIMGYEYILDGVNDPDSATVIIYAGDKNGNDLVPILTIEGIGTASVAEGLGGDNSIQPILLKKKNLYFSASGLGSGTNDGIFKLIIQLP